nr:25S rRNA (uracil2634-N3)-methyltransferase [Ipomoea batatas]
MRMMQEEVEGLAFAAEEDNVKWIMHYSSHHKILLVGEGDFSFSAALAHAFEFLLENYGNAASNIVALRRRGCMVIHGVDATNMANHPLLQGFMFHRIVFNFPFADLIKAPVIILVTIPNVALEVMIILIAILAKLISFDFWVTVT